ncbi:DUF5068 domain-containing protein [Bacillus sp. SM2101]|uniref:DUF5068 domain-containing protein n=1 Tax=Bacillus sp. SM2101 TaxID=2805366 RepID=UPI001BDE89EE|nr:DUF5068 domain-containing protein [Bacillus sp. SM2101]
MIKRKFLTMLSIGVLFLAACGDDEKASSEEKEEKPKMEETSTEEKAPEEEEKVEENTQTTGELNPIIAEETEGNVEVIYTNKEPNYTHDLDGFKVSVDEYQIVKVTDMNTDYNIAFDDQTEGYVITTKVTVNNTTDKPLYYTNFHKIQLSSNLDYIQNNGRKLVPEDQQIAKIKQNKDQISLFEAGETVTGLMTFILTNEELEKLKTVSTKYIIEGGVADNDMFKNSNQQHSDAFIFAFEGNETGNQTTSNFLQDRLTTDNMADKEMIFEETGINETKNIDKVNIQVDTVQYTVIEPTEASKPRFENFGDNGIVALTVKLNIDNQSTEPLRISGLGTKLNIDDNRATIFSEGMVEPRELEAISPGEKGEKLHVFLFRKDEFELYKKFDMEVGPFKGEDGKDLFKGKSATFSLPR